MRWNEGTVLSFHIYGTSRTVPVVSLPIFVRFRASLRRNSERIYMFYHASLMWNAGTVPSFHPDHLQRFVQTTGAVALNVHTDRIFHDL